MSVCSFAGCLCRPPLWLCRTAKERQSRSCRLGTRPHLADGVLGQGVGRCAGVSFQSATAGSERQLHAAWRRYIARYVPPASRPARTGASLCGRPQPKMLQNGARKLLKGGSRTGRRKSARHCMVLGTQRSSASVLYQTSRNCQRYSMAAALESPACCDRAPEGCCMQTLPALPDAC